MGPIGIPELLIILAIVVLIMGPKRIPRAGRAIGTGIKEFKDSIGKRDQDEGLPAASEESEPLDGEVVREESRR